MKVFYLNRFIHLIFLSILFFTLLIGFYAGTFFVLIVYSASLYLFRRKRGVFKENPSLTEGVLYAPSNGKIIRIKPGSNHPNLGEGLTEILVRLPWNAEYGIYLPFTSEVKDLLALKGRDFFRFSKLENTNIVDRAGVLISLESQKGDEIGLQLLKCPTGLWPEIKVMPGDRGKRQANIGLLPFGGTLALYIPEKYEILVQEGQEVVAGESLIAGQQ
ncbi:MAG: hypothetical protein CME70_21970 [Halobacteriovorax sp.]|nr:hypothetical protein [Halobacteriovorax sp.]